MCVCVCVCVNVSVRTLPSVVPPTVWGVALLWLLATLTLPSPTGISEWEPSHPPHPHWLVLEAPAPFPVRVAAAGLPSGSCPRPSPVPRGSFLPLSTACLPAHTRLRQPLPMLGGASGRPLSSLPLPHLSYSFPMGLSLSNPLQERDAPLCLGLPSLGELRQGHPFSKPQFFI